MIDCCFIETFYSTCSHSPGILKSLLEEIRREKDESDEESDGEHSMVTAGGEANSPDNEFQKGRKKRNRQEDAADDSEAASLLDQVERADAVSEEGEGSEYEEDEEDEHRVADAGATPPRPGAGAGSGLKRKLTAGTSQGPIHTLLFTQVAHCRRYKFQNQ